MAYRGPTTLTYPARYLIHQGQVYITDHVHTVSRHQYTTPEAPPNPMAQPLPYRPDSGTDQPAPAGDSHAVQSYRLPGDNTNGLLGRVYDRLRGVRGSVR